jgi:hypothetical protein
MIKVLDHGWDEMRMTKGVIDGADFASAIFSIWIGPHPLNESLRSTLLGVP